jgi:tetraacyldisaccharide 4'-kinase
MKNQLFLWGERLIEKGAWFLAPFSWVWSLVSYFRNLFYDWQWFSIASLPCTVVSVGNIVAGGTGKTPFVLLLAQMFPSRKVAILSRGYGAFADEAALLSRRLPQVKVYTGKDRISSGKKAILEGAELLILDDGFQYRKLSRDFNFVLLDGEDPFGKGHFLPWGYLRDSPKRLRSADAVFVNGKDLTLRVKKILTLNGDPIGSIKGWRVALFSGIAKPLKFKKTVVEIGAEVVFERVFADHALIPITLLKELSDEAKEQGATALLCTEKDFVKLPQDLVLSLPLLFLEMEMKMLGDRANWEKLIAKIDQKIDNYSSL